MGIIDAYTGRQISDSDIRDWFNATPRSDADVASRSAELGLNSDQITSALSVGRNGNQDQSKVNDWVSDTNNGYQWGDSGALIKIPVKKAAAAAAAAPANSAPASPSPTAWNVTPDQTVEGRINGILNPNNPIMQQARTRSLEAMNARGLANSSLAVTAGDSAAYDAAIPIAGADAATFAKAAGYNADQINQFTTNDLNRQTQLALGQMSSNTQMSTAQLSADTQKYIAGMDNTQKTQAQQLQLANTTLLQTNSQAAQAFNTAMSAINNITQNSQMDADTKTRATANIWHDVQSQMKVISATSGLDLSSQLNFANYPGFDEKGNWVGFTAATATSAAIAGDGYTAPLDNNNGGSA